MKARFSILLMVIMSMAGFAAAQDDVIRYVNFRVYDPVYVALDQGFFEDEGITVKIVGDVLAGPTAIQAVASGQAEAGLSSIPAIINANAAGLPIQGVTDIQSALEGQPLEEYFVRADSPYQTLDDVVGSKFAVNLWYSSFHYTAIMALENEGYQESDMQFVLLPFPQQTPALVAGEVDVIGLMEPYASQTREQYGDEVRVLFDASDVFGEKQFTLHFVNRIWAENNPNKATKFTSGIVHAIEWIEENPDEARNIIAEYTGVDAEYVPDYHFQPDGQVNMDDVSFWLGYLQDRGDVTATWLTPEMIATNKYNPYVEE